jgi:Ca-activated chloride channel family protein
LKENQVTKLIMLTDGQANKGETKKSVLGGQSQKFREDYGITTSTIGIGEDFNEELLDVISSESGGRFWYIKEAKIESIIETEFQGAMDILLETPKVELMLPKGITISKELNGLRKIADKYSLRPITSKYENQFAVRLEINPEMVAEKRFEIKAFLYNRNSKVNECIKSIQLDEYGKVVTAPKNSAVPAIVAKYEKSMTEEKMIEKMESGDFDFMKKMIVAEIGGMKKVMDKTEDEKQRIMLKAELDEMKNMQLVSETLDRLSQLNSTKYRLTITDFIKNAKKMIMHQHHRNRAWHMQTPLEVQIQTDFLRETLNLIENLLEDNPGDAELENIKNEIHAKLASY